MRNKYVFVTILLGVMLLVSVLVTKVYVKESTKTAENKNEQITIVTSFYPMYIAVANIIDGMDDIRVENLSEPQTGCLHDFQLTPKDMKLLSGADVFVVNGGGIENFISDVAKTYPKLQIVEACEGISLLEGEEHDHGHAHEEEHGHDEAVAHEEEDHDHEHGEENAHAWMSVSSYREQIAKIAEELSVMFPEDANLFMQNVTSYDQKLAKLQNEQEELRESLQGKEVILFHEAYAYVAKDYGMEVAQILDLDEERQVSAGEVAQVLEEIQEHGVSLILAEERYGKEMAQTIQKEADVNVVYLDTLNRGNYEKDSYLVGMQANIDLLKTIAAE